MMIRIPNSFLKTSSGIEELYLETNFIKKIELRRRDANAINQEEESREIWIWDENSSRLDLIAETLAEARKLLSYFLG